MDVTPPSALRRIGIALAGLAVAGLTATACVLSFDDLRALAVVGTARADLAYLYPAAFDALLAVALISVLLLRSGRLLVRLQAAVVLVLLIAAAATVNVLVTTNGIARLPVDAVAVGVAVAPWVMLTVALWLWLVMIKHVQARRGPDEPAEGTAERDIVPFRGPREAPPLVGTAEQEPEPTPVIGPTPAPETPPVPPIPVSQRVTRWESEPTGTAEPQAVPKPRTEPAPTLRTRAPDPAEAPSAAPHFTKTNPTAAPTAASHPAEIQRDETERAETKPTGTKPAETQPAEAPSAAPYRTETDPTAAPTAAVQPAETQPAEEWTRAGEGRRQDADDVTAPHPVYAADQREPVEEPELDRPIRWGDLARTEPTDVLVHPRPDDSRDPDSVRDADTQPVRVVSEQRLRPLASSAATRADSPDPGHGPESADESEPVLGPPETHDSPADTHETHDSPRETQEDPPESQKIAGETRTGPHEAQDGPGETHTGLHETDDGSRETLEGPGETQKAPLPDAPSGRLRSTPLPPEE
ncbi:DUF2637 domain-containing protein [Nonomuraea sp. NPDC059194]|uniref:DUF2637 domain-containing protein n=1 Tax=Nonomuraea sp. NPDC059194 TaxID=3346764 RepID=UPI0036B1FAAC